MLSVAGAIGRFHLQMTPQISVITATRNALKDLPALASSLLRYPPDLIEWVVVDALSDDGTVQYLQDLRDPRVSWTSEADSGIYDAWNKGVNRARGRWIMFLGADDEVGQGWLEACAAAPDVDLVYGALQVHGPGGEFWTRVDAGPWEAVRTQLRERMTLPHPGLAHHRSLFESARFDTTFRVAGDFHFLSRANLRSGLRLPTTQAIMRFGGMSNRPDLVELGYRETLRVLGEHGARMSLKDRLRWRVKRITSAMPRVYLALQDFRWRSRRKL